MNANMISEVITYNLTNLNNLQKFNIFKLTNHIDIQNVNNSNHATLRNNLIDRMLKVYQMNISFKNDLQPIFEIQNIYADVTYTNLTILSPNIINIDNLSKSNIKINLNVLRALADQIANIFNTSFTYLNTTQDNEYFYKTEMLAIHSQGQLVGYVGLLKSSQLREYDLSNHSVYCLSINFESLLKTYKHQEFKIKHINNLMPIFKDISFTINDKESIRYMIEAIDKLPFISNYQ
jgi:phenylalanyl-tRNA synthetase beta subunit